MLIRRDPKGRDRGMNNLERLWSGPFEVMERVGRGRYRISAEKGETIVTVSIMKPFRDPVCGNRVPLHFCTFTPTRRRWWTLRVSLSKIF